MLTICDLETIYTYRRFGGTRGKKLRSQTTSRLILKEGNRRNHCRENVRSGVTGCMSGQLFEYLQGRNKMRAVVSRGGSTVTSAQVNGDRWHIHQLNMQSSLHLATTCNWLHIHKGSLFKKSVIREASTVSCVAGPPLLHILQSAAFH